MNLSADEREYLRREVSRRRQTVVCPGCGAAVPKTTKRRRYCTVACANRHWHVRKAEQHRTVPPLTLAGPV